MSLTFVSENLLYPNNLTHENICDILEKMNKRNIDYADIYFESSYKETWVLEDNTIKYGSYNIDQGFGVRAIIGEKTGFSYSDKITLTALNKSARTASSIILDKNNNIDKNKKKQKNIKYNTIYSKLNPIESLSREKKLDILYRINNLARNTDTRVKEVIAILSGVYKQILVAATDGTLIADVRPLIHLSINIHVEQDGKREIGVSGGGGRVCYDFFLDNIDGEIRADIWTREAVRIALVNLYAVEAPSGPMPVVLGSGWPGILLHEAVGHGLEGDFNRRGISVFNNKIGKCVASNICTVVDNAQIPNLRGSLNIDDEGVPGQLNILIENGYLKGYMQDKLNAKLMGVKPTGNGRRESYAHLPIPRMTNTYMMAGNSTPEDIIYSVDKGIYATNFGSGQVDITSGKFVFSTSEAYLINKGRITKPVKSATLIGSGIEIMQHISMVGNDLELDNGVGLCVKNGQNVPVGVGQPTLKIKKITVGGTALS